MAFYATARSRRVALPCSCFRLPHQHILITKHGLLCSGANIVFRLCIGAKLAAASMRERTLDDDDESAALLAFSRPPYVTVMSLLARGFCVMHQCAQVKVRNTFDLRLPTSHCILCNCCISYIRNISRLTFADHPDVPYAA